MHRLRSQPSARFPRHVLSPGGRRPTRRARPATIRRSPGRREPWCAATRGSGSRRRTTSPACVFAADRSSRPPAATAWSAAKRRRSAACSSAAQRCPIRRPKRSPRASASRSRITSRAQSQAALAQPRHRQGPDVRAQRPAPPQRRLVVVALASAARRALRPAAAGGIRASGNGCGWSPAVARDRADQPQVAAGLRFLERLQQGVQAAWFTASAGSTITTWAPPYCGVSDRLLGQARGSGRSRSRCAAGCFPCS